MSSMAARWTMAGCRQDRYRVNDLLAGFTFALDRWLFPSNASSLKLLGFCHAVHGFLRRGSVCLRGPDGIGMTSSSMA